MSDFAQPDLEYGDSQYMRFFTTVTPAGKAEFFGIAVILNVALFAFAFKVFKLKIDIFEQEFGWAVDKLDEMAFVFVAYAGLATINCARRLKDANMKGGTAVIAIVPVIGQLYQLGLAVLENKTKAGFTPYGDNPYDPNSWVPPVDSSGKNTGPAVSFRGEALMLPGEGRDEAA